MQFSQEDLAFQREVRAFIQANLPDDVRKKVIHGNEVTKDDYTRWHRTLYQKGWIAPNWPKEHGGCGWSVIQRYIFDEECGLAGAPRLSPFGLGMVGPVIMHFGTEAQKQRYLPNILSGEETWCQGYSEPGSGSDLASLQTRAERKSDHYLINGSKLWTSLAHHADLIFCLVRTSIEKKKQDGISFLVFRIKDQPGIEIRPLITLNGLRHVNQVFFTDVKVPLDSLIGEEGKGWTIAKYLLEHERVSGGGVGALKTALQRVKDMAKAELSDGKPLIEDSDFRRRVAQTEIELIAVEQTMLRALAAFSADRPIGAVSSLIKIRRSEVEQMISELAVMAAHYYAMPYNVASLRDGWNEEPIGPEDANALTPSYMFLRAASIYSGSNEIQRNIIAKADLRLS
jgi:alkylation response protein AidB-like acyl-CoA dehydrogenase